MAPVPQSFTALLKRSLGSGIFSKTVHHLSSTSSRLYARRSAILTSSLHALHKRDDEDNKDKNKDYAPGRGATDASKIDNSAFLALFAILGAAMVIGGIWFFFWAKNGGCVFRKGDWDDYKSTVLRRKGPDGKTLSNATKSTRLGGRTVLSSFAAGYSDVNSAETYTDYDGGREQQQKPMREVGRSSKAMKQEQKRQKKQEQYQQKQQQQQQSFPKFPKDVDNDVREYRHEKPARVGGLNRRHDGSHFDYTNTDRSDAFTEDSSAAPLVANISPNVTPKKGEKKGFLEKRRDKKRMKEDDKKKKATMTGGMQQTYPGPSILKDSSPQAQRNSTPRRSRPSAAYSFREGDDSPSARLTRSGGDYYNHRDQERYSNPPSNPSAQDSYYNSYRPRAQQPNYRQSPRSSQPSSRQSSPRKHAQRTDDVESDAGTKVYRHHIPGLSHSEVGVEDSISQVGARKTRHGYRRGGTGRRDSLSESD